MSASNLRQNPFTGAYSPRTITNEQKTVAEFSFLPGIYGFILDDKPSPDTNSITFITDDTASTEYTIITSGTPSAGQVRYSPQNGICVFNVADNGTDFLISYDGYGTNMTVEAITGLITVPSYSAIDALTEKTSIVANDLLILGDSATNTTKKIKKSSLADSSGGFAGLTLFKINFKNALNTFTSFFTNANTAARTYTFQDRDGTIADNTDVAPLIDGWVPRTETFTYASASAPEFTMTVPGDLTGVIYQDMKLKLTQTTVKYFAVMRVVHSAGTTTITLYGGTDYTLVNAAISAVYYSPVSTPAGFPKNPEKWTIEATDSSDRTQSNPASATWYNLTNASIGAKTGNWRWVYAVNARYNFSNASRLLTTLSTANNSESDSKNTCTSYAGAADNEDNMQKSGFISLSAAATYYLNTRASAAAGAGSIQFLNATVGPMIIRFTWAAL